jgi:hypothetical protein
LKKERDRDRERDRERERERERERKRKREGERESNTLCVLRLCKHFTSSPPAIFGFLYAVH